MSRFFGDPYSLPSDSHRILRGSCAFFFLVIVLVGTVEFQGVKIYSMKGKKPEKVALLS